jgi:exo-1,4-beta-D-glucosaminidase
VKQLVQSAALVLFFFAAIGAQAQQRQMLHDGWMIQSSATAGVDGAAISSSSYNPAGWHRATVPSTVVGTLVDDGVYPDPFFGMNFRSLPGVTYKIGANFVHTDMDPQSPYAVPWWYRTTFRVPAAMRGKRITLNFDGINYRANVWLNGRRLADSTMVAGTYRRYELDVTDAVNAAGTNVLAV